ncbi:MAG: hypothetical protein R3Y07_05510 [Eubacteriales bacterium]
MTMRMKEQDIARDNFALGEKRGLELGERRNKEKIAKKLLTIMSDSEIAIATELTLEEVRNLRNST